MLFFAINANSTTILILGDSLSAGYQMPVEQSWPNLLPSAFNALPNVSNKHSTIKVINGSISGDTSANGLARMPSLLEQHKPDWVLIELGANDALRGFEPNTVKANLTHIIDSCRQFGAQPILMQIEAPPNYGKRYSQLFHQIYPQLASEKQLPLIPFFLAEIITKPEWIMSDGLHPTAAAQPWIGQWIAAKLIEII